MTYLTLCDILCLSEVLIMFAQRLKELRKKNNMTQVQLADKLGVSKGTVAMWETGHRSPSVEMILKLSDVFNRNMEYILGHSDDEAPSQFTHSQVRDFELNGMKIDLYQIAMRYFALDEYGKKTIKTLIDAEYDRCLNQDSLYNTSHIVVDVNILPLFKND